MGFTTELRNKILNHIFRGQSMDVPSSVYVGLFVDGHEVSGGGYSRVEVTFGNPSNGVITNTTSVNYPIASSDWGNVDSAAIFDSITGGNRLSDSQAITAQEVGENQQFIIPIGNLTVELRSV